MSGRIFVGALTPFDCFGPLRDSMPARSLKAEYCDVLGDDSIEPIGRYRFLVD
jgi:hypothetical protein